jgi:hypothetical protein
LYVRGGNLAARSGRARRTFDTAQNVGLRLENMTIDRT